MSTFTIHPGSSETLAALERNIGFIPNLAAAIGASPTAIGGFVGLQTALRGSTLTGLDDEAMVQVRRALERMLSHHEPHPAVVMDRHWNIVRANAAADELFGWLLGDADPDEQANVVRLMFGPLRPHVANWEETGEALVQRVHREAVGGVPDRVTQALLDEVLALDGIPERWRTRRPSAGIRPSSRS
jgi:PAS domain-containing protein